MLNVNFIGRLGADAEEKVSTAGNHFLTLRVAVDGYVKKERTTDWVRVTYVGERATKMKEFLTKGRQVYVAGQARIDTYQTKNGDWTGSFDVIADRIDFVSSGGNGQQQGEQEQQTSMTTTAKPAAKPAEPAPSAPAPVDAPADIDPSDDLPF